MISVEISERGSALEAIASEWEILVGDSFSRAFSQPAWYRAWLEALPAQEIAVVSAREEGRLIGVLPLAHSRTDSRGLYFRQIAPIARGDYQPPVVLPERVAEVLPLLLDAAFGYYGRTGVLWWPNVPETDPSIAVIRSYLASRGMPWTEATELCPRLRLNGCNFETIEKNWTTKHRTDVRRRRKLLTDDKGPFYLWTPSSIAEAEPVLNEFFKVHDEKWLAQGMPGMFQDPVQRRFYHAVLRHLFGKGLHFSTVRCGDTDISYQFGFFVGGWVQWYRPSYRSEFHNFSPSKLHVALVIEEVCRLNGQGLDFLLGDEAYKSLWTNENLSVISFHAGFHKWAPSYLWFSRGKPYVKNRLANRYMRARAWLQKLRKKD